MREENKVVEKKSKSGCTVVLLCLAFLLIGAGGMYYLISTKLGVMNKQDTNVDNKEVSLNPDGVLVRELVARLDYNTECGVNELLYKNSKTTIENLDKSYLKVLTAKQANGKNLNGAIAFTKEKFDSSAKELFGKEMSLDSSDITNICPSIAYDSINQKYIGTTNPCEKKTCSYENKRHIVKSFKKENYLYIVVAVVAINQESKKISNMNDLNSVVEGVDINTFDIEKDYEKVNNYKYTFIYDSDNNNYIFKSIELEK